MAQTQYQPGLVLTLQPQREGNVCVTIPQNTYMPFTAVIKVLAEHQIKRSD